MSITVLKAGICDTIQDLGRHGYGALGINPSGSMDVLAMQCANALVANPLPTAVIEMHFPAASLRFNTGAIIAISGADFNAIITSQEGERVSVPINKTVFIPAKAVLGFYSKTNGERCYLAVHGGFNLTPWLNSYSTNLAIKQGGLHGSAFKKNDLLQFARQESLPSGKVRLAPWAANFYSWYTDEGTLNILPGPEWDWLDEESKRNFSRNTYRITGQSNRMGIAIHGNQLVAQNTEQLLSTGVNYGTIQLLPNGQLMILTADHPATGGYPRIANIITAHLPKLAQATAKTNIRFLATTPENATALLLLQQKELRQMQQAVRLQLANFLR